MKLFTETYMSPHAHQGQFTNVFIEETCVIHKRKEKYLAIKFEMYYEKNNVNVVLSEKIMEFFGLDGDEATTNKTALVKKLNPLYNPEDEESIEPEYLIFPLLQILYENSGNLPEEYIIESYGYPNYTDALLYFNSGDFNNPEIIIENPLAIGFLMNNLIMNNEPVINQFTFLPNE